MSKCKQKSADRTFKKIFFLSSIQDLVKFYKNIFLPQGEKSESPLWARMGPFYIFWSNCMSYTVPVLELCEKIKEISQKACLWQAVKKGQIFSGCRVFFGGYCNYNVNFL